MTSSRRVVLATGVAGIVTTGVLAALWSGYEQNRRFVDALAARVDSARLVVLEVPNRQSEDVLSIAPALGAVRALAEEGGWNEPMLAVWGLGQGTKLQVASRMAYERLLVDALLPRLALRVEAELRSLRQPESLYEALKAYIMLHQPAHFDAAALKAYVEADWDRRPGRIFTVADREALSRHLDALLAQGAPASPVALDKGLVESVRAQIARQSLPQRIYGRLRQQGLGSEFPEFTIAGKAGGNAALVFTRASGQPLTRGVPGLFTHDGYRKGFQARVGAVARQLGREQAWVLGLKAPTPGQGSDATLDLRLVEEVRRIYLDEYAATWEAFIADIRLVPSTSLAQSARTTQVLAAPDSPLLPLLKAIARETTLIGDPASRDPLVGQIGSPAGEKPIERIVDERFVGLRRLVTAPDGGKSPGEGLVERLGELQALLSAIDAAAKSGAPPPSSPLPASFKAEAATLPQPLRSMLDSLGGTTARVESLRVRESLGQDVNAQVSGFCKAAVAGRYPVASDAVQDVAPSDFTALFGPGGKFAQLQEKLAPYIDTSTRPWRFRPVDGAALGTDAGTLPQFERAAVIRETFFRPGADGVQLRLEFKPVEMDPALTQFVLDVDGQVVRFAHGPALPTTVQWPGPRGSGQVRLLAQPGTAAPRVHEGPWALLRLFDRVVVQPGATSDKFRATFDFDGRKAVFDVSTSSPRNPFRLAELRQFSCPAGL